jgi:alanine racemase
MPRPIEAVVDRAAIAHNLGVVRARTPGRFVWAVVKADAYGHGIERVLPALAAADGLALLDLAEAQRARAAGWSRPILLLEGFFDAGDLDAVRTLGLTPVVHCFEQIGMLEGIGAGTPVEVYLKLNTGMNRLGFAPGQADAALRRLRAVAAIRVISLLTHLANADRADAGQGPAGVDEQLRELRAALPQWDGPYSVANSAAVFLHPQVGGQSIRPGIALYGGTPASGTAARRFGLLPAMRLASRVLAIQPVAAGHSIGYGGRWVAGRDSRIAVVACGYADGYPRHAPDGTPVAVAGQRAPLAGRVSMDMLTVDVTEVPQAANGSPVELWGAQVPIDEVAERAGTVGYELMCALAPRVPVRTIG